MSSEYKKQVYQKWIERGRPWFDIDPTKEPTYAERQIIIEMKKQENTKSKRDIELERSAKNIHEKYGKYGKIPDTIFESLSNYLKRVKITLTVPKILYHGTTMLRWDMIKQDRLLRCNMPKSYEAEEYFGSGYVYFTTDLNDAIVYGLSKSLLDMASNDLEKWMKLNPNYRDPVVLGIKTSELRDKLEINYGINTPLVQQIPSKRNENTQLYKHKGNIKLEHLFLHKYAPFSAFDRDQINQIKKYHEKKLHASKSIMNRIGSESVMKQISLVKIPKIGKFA